MNDHVKVWGERYVAELRRQRELDAKAWGFISWVSIAADFMVADLATVGTMQRRAKELLAEKEKCDGK